MGEHTPGPWSLPHFAKPDVGCECGYVLTDHMMGAVATVHCSGEGEDWVNHGDNPKFAEAVANANLIAAAPELLASLSKLVEVYGCFKGEPFDLPADHPLVAARAVLAKATGTPPNPRSTHDDR